MNPCQRPPLPVLSISGLIPGIWLLLLVVATPGAVAADFAPTPVPSRTVLNPTAHPERSQTVTWRTDAATVTGAAEVRPASGGPVTTVTAAAKDPVTLPGWTYSSRHHTATFTGLKPDTDYEYRVGGDAGWSGWMGFRTAAADLAKPLELLTFGDAQIGLQSVWPGIVDLAFARVPNASASLFAGDLVDQGSDDDQWGQWFAGLGDSSTRINQIPAAGNHELEGDSLLTQFGSHFTFPGNGPVTDLSHHTYNLKATTGFTDFQGVRIITLDGNDFFPEAQVSFLRQALRTNPNRWSVLLIHQPFISNEPGGASPFLTRAPFMPVLAQYPPDLILQGHNHSYARGYLNRFTRDDGSHGGPVFLTSVSGPKRTAASEGPPDDWSAANATRVKSLKYTATFQQLSFTRDRLRVRSFIAYKQPDSDAAGDVGTLADSFTVIRRPDGSKVIREGILNPKPRPGRIRTVRISKVHRGTAARATVILTGAGRLRATGKTADGRAKLRPVTRTVTGPKTVTVPLRVGRAATRLPHGGRLRFVVEFTFKPKQGSSRRIRRGVTLTWR